MRNWLMRRPGAWFVLAGALLVARASAELAEPAYYDPVTPFDYAAAILSSLAWLALAVALALWWRTRPIRGSSFLLLTAAIGVAASGVGNFFEDVVDVPAGEALFTYGGMAGVASLVVAALVLLTVGHSRLAGVLLLAFAAGSAFPDSGGEFLSGAALVALGYLAMQQSQTDYQLAAQ